MARQLDAKPGLLAGTRGGGAAGHALHALMKSARLERRVSRGQELTDWLTEADLEVAVRTRSELARVIARRQGISVRQAKRQVRDLERVVRRVEGGTPSRGKRTRRSFERTGWNLKDALTQGIEEVREGLGRVLVTGGLAGKSGTRLPRPGGLGGKPGTRLPRPGGYQGSPSPNPAPPPRPAPDAGGAMGSPVPRVAADDAEAS